MFEQTFYNLLNSIMEMSDEEIKNIINNNKRIFEKAFGGKNG